MIRLGPGEWPPDRPFTDPGLVHGDLEVLVSLVQELNAARCADPALDPPEPGRDRVIVTRSGGSHGENPVAVVGFFGDRRPDGSQELADEVERVNTKMVADFDDFPLLLGYVSRLLDDDFNYANLVVLAGEDGIARWRDLPQHIPAALDIAPNFYRSVRIYNGVMPCGIACWDQLRLRVVKYWDYRQSTLWHAVREIDEISSSIIS